jgi:anti-sigma regulatory factor (Ser/Thr protein kinase)
MKIETIYKLAVLPQIRYFITESAGLYGATEREKMAIEFAVEEAAAHIIGNYPEADGTFEISCHLVNGGRTLRVVLSNKGIPVDIDNLPEYSTDNPENTIDGLNFFLIKKFTDKFYMENRGRAGWLTVLEKNLHSAAPMSEPDKTTAQPVRTGRFNIEFAGPDDAYEITKLAYFTYRYSYSKSVFYYPEMLREALSNSSVISFIARNEEGEIVAHAAYMRSPYCVEIVEAGGLMTRPEYRRSMAGMRLLKTQHRYPLKENTSILMVESNLVTSHTGSQRITKSMKFVPLALKLSVHEHADFRDIEAAKNLNPRETLLYSVWAPQGRSTPFTIFTPATHCDIIKELLANIGFPVTVSSETRTIEPGESRFDIDKKEEYALAIIYIKHLSGGWCKKLKSMRRTLSIDGFSTIQLQIPADAPLPADINEQLAEAGFFFSGIMPKTTERWQLLYTFLNNQKFDFSSITLIDPVAVRLRDYVELCSTEIDL